MVATVCHAVASQPFLRPKFAPLYLLGDDADADDYFYPTLSFSTGYMNTDQVYARW